MALFQVVERGEGIEGAIISGLARRRGPFGGGRSDRPALLVVSPRAAEGGAELPAACRTALLPGDGAGPPRGLEAASAVSYGSAPKNTLTVSSREEGRLWAALQRELVTVEGRVVERQEFPVALPPGVGELAALAAAGALLLLGVPPEELGRPAEE